MTSETARKMCGKCGATLKYKEIPLFGDSDLGVMDAWLACSECGQKYNLWTGKERV